SVSRLQAATAAAVLPGRNRARRKSIQSNRRNGTTLSTTRRRLRALMKRVGCEVRLRQGYGGQPSRGLPTVAHGEVNKRERRLVSLNFSSWNRVVSWLRQLRS